MGCPKIEKGQDSTNLVADAGFFNGTSRPECWENEPDFANAVGMEKFSVHNPELDWQLQLSLTSRLVESTSLTKYSEYRVSRSLPAYAAARGL